MSRYKKRIDFSANSVSFEQHFVIYYPELVLNEIPDIQIQPRFVMLNLLKLKIRPKPSLLINSTNQIRVTNIHFYKNKHFQ